MQLLHASHKLLKYIYKMVLFACHSYWFGALKKQQIGKNMATKTTQELLRTQVGEMLLSDWNARWEPLPDAFTKRHPEFRREVGLIRTIRNDVTTYIVRATETKGGIAKGMRRLAGPEQSGNRSVGPQGVRKEKDTLRVEILRVDDPHNPIKVTKELKTQMRYLHKPTGDKPFQRHLEKLRAGK